MYKLNKQSLFNKISSSTLKAIVFLAMIFVGLSAAKAQLTVSVTNPNSATPALSSSYASLSSAISALNNVTAFSGPVTLTCSGTSEVAPLGGYSISFSGTTSLTNKVVINGASATVYAAASPTVGSQTDAIFKIIGCDFVTIQNFVMNENASNNIDAPLGAQRMTEFGVALFAATATNGAQNNTIQNNTINLGSSLGGTPVYYRNAIGIFSSSASSATAPASARPATSLAGANSNNKIYGNTISGVTTGIYFVAPAQTSTILESGNDIGGTSVATGNNITFANSNLVSDLTYVSFSGTTPGGVYFRNVVGNSVRFNTITNGANLTINYGGIFSAVGTAPSGVTYTSNFSDNTISINNNQPNTLITGIDFGSGITTGTITCNNNNVTILSSSIDLANATALTGIKAAYAAANSTVNNNTVLLNPKITYTAGPSVSNSGALTCISVPSGATSTINVMGNNLKIVRTGTTGATFSGIQIGIQATVAALNMNIGASGTGNTIAVYDSIQGTSAFATVTLIAASATHTNLNVSYNTLGSGIGIYNGTGTLTGILHQAVIVTSVNINNNTFTLDRTTSNGGTFNAINGGNSTNNTLTSFSISNNTVNYVGPTSTSGAFSGITNSDIVPTTFAKNITNNSFTASGSFSTMTGITATGGKNEITGNTFDLTSTTNLTATPTIYGVTGSLGSANNKYNIYSNIFTNLRTTGTSVGATIYAVFLTGGTSNNIYNNTITNISTAAGTGVGTVAGITIQSNNIADTTNIYRNNIYNLQNNSIGVGSSISGIRLLGSSGTAVAITNIYNNLISQTNSVGLTSAGSSIYGIYMNTTAALTTHNIYHNTIYLSSTSTGTNFGAIGIYHTANSTSTISSLNMRNNVVVNLVAPTGNGVSYAFQRNSSLLNNYATTSNNNLLYCATGIYNDGTYTDMTISDFISRVGPRELNSVSENLNFINTSTPSNSQYLKLSSSVATQAESGGSTISGYTDDYTTNAIRTGYPKSGQVNGYGTAPDMGAFEQDLISQDISGPAIVYTAVSSTTSTSAVSITASISDKSGVPTTGTGLPVLYWKAGNGAYAAVTGTYVSGNNFSFTFGGGSINDIISYYFVAQDNLGNLSASPSAGTSSLTSNPPYAGNPPSSPSAYNILSAFSGTYIIGGNGNLANGADYMSLSEAFADVTPGQVRSVYVTNGGTGYTVAPTVSIIGGGGVGATATASIDVSTGAITRINVTNYGVGYSSSPSIILNNNTGSGATFTVNISSGKAMGAASTFALASSYNSACENSFPIVVPVITGMSATNTITIKPNTGVTTSISGFSSTAIINLAGADYVTIDGSNNGSSSKDLSITNTNSLGASSAVIQISSLGTGLGATNNTIKNLNIANGTADQSNYAICAGGTTIGTSGADNDNLTIQNNTITSANYGIYAIGTASTTSGGNDNLLVTGNTITINSNYTPMAIKVGNSLNSTVLLNVIDVYNRDNNLAQNFQSNTPIGISIEAGFVSSTITRNQILRVESAILSGSGVRGISIGTSSTTSNLTVSNNVIYGIAGVNSQSFYNGSFLYSSSIGIAIGGNPGGDLGNATGGVKLYHNSVNLSGSYSNNLSTNPILTAALYVGSSVTTLDMRNNVFSNSQTNTALGATAKSYAIYSAAATTGYTTNDYNDYYVSGTNGVLGFLTSDRTNLAGIQAGFTQNTHSLANDPTFNGVANLKPSLGATILNAGVTISGQTVDFLGNTRNVSNPSMGAYESGADESAPSITYTNLSNTQSINSQIISASIVDVGATNSGVNTTTASPIIYFKKSTDANVFGVTNDNTGNGWKYVQTSSTSSPFTMTIDVSVLQSAPAINDVIQYFVVAQDNNGYLASNPSTGFVGTNVSTITSAPTTPNSYIIVGPPLSAGTYRVGTSSSYDYPTITAAARDLNLRGISGPVVLELIDASYTSATESFPITFGAVVGASATNNIIIRPSATSSGASVGTSNTTGIFNFDRGSYYTLDGRAGGVGSTNILNIYNNSITTGYTLNYVNDASNNFVKYTNIQGSAQSYSNSIFTFTAGTIQIGTTNYTTGNDSNSFTNCNIYDGAATPQVGIYAIGTTGKSNDFNIFRNNNIYNFNGTFNSNGTLNQSSFGLYIDGNNNSFSIDSNNFYQTSSRQQVANGSTNIISAIYVTAFTGTTKGVDFSITGNYIGGSAPQCAGSPMTYNPSALGIANPQLIYVDLGTSKVSNIQGNTINNFQATSNGTANHYLINIFGGKVNVGTITPNYLGSQTSTGSIVMSSGATTNFFIGIGTGSTTAAAYDTIRIQNNFIGGMETNISRLSSFVSGISLRGIDLAANTSGYYVVNNNTIGGSVANSMMQKSANSIVGIFCRTTSAGTYVHQINNNLIRNLTSIHTSSLTSPVAAPIGISTTGASSVQIKNNNISYLTGASSANSTGITASLIGILMGSSGTNGITIDNNVVHTLVSTSNTSTAITMSGITVSGPVTGTNTITRNIVHSVNATKAGSTINGIDVVAGAFTYANNMVRLGIDQNGSNMTSTFTLKGINEIAGTNNYYFNTIYVGGSSVAAGADYTYAFTSNVSSGTRNIRNNIFSNKRTSVSGSIAKHYAISLNNTTGLTINYNNYFTSAAPTGVINSTDAAALSDWKIATAQDVNSITENPIFVSGNGTNSTVDMHIIPNSISLMESGGVNISGYATDIDGDVRPGPVGSVNGGGTVSDIGADEFDGALFQLNVGALALASPSGTCASSGKTVSIRIKNYASTQAIDFSQNPVVVTASVSGTNPFTFTPVTLTSGTLAPGSTLDVDMSNNYDMSALGTYTFNASTILFGDANTSNDAMAANAVTTTNLTVGNNTSSVTQICSSNGIPTLTTTATGGNIQWRQSTVSANGPWTNVGSNSTTYTPINPITTTTYYSALISCNSTSISAGDTVTVQIPEILSFSGSTTCANTAASLSATPNNTQVINWYTSSSATVPVATGNTYNPVVTTTTTYYASAATTQNVQTSTSGGNTWNQNTTLGSFDHNTSNQCAVFDALKDITISTLDIYPFDPAGTSFTIQVRQTNTSGTLIASYTGVTSVQNTGSTPTIAQTVPVNFSIPAGTNYVISFTSNPGCWRGGSFAFPYPFVVSGLLNYKAAGFGTAASGTTANLLYYFYNLTVSSACESARQPIVATVLATPNAPTGLSTISKTGSSINVSWNAASGASSYSLDVATDTGFTSMVSGYNNLSVAGTSQSITGLSALTNYYIRVRSENGTCTSLNSFRLDETTNANNVSIQVSAFIQGLYVGAGAMTPAPFNANGISPTNVADTIIVELHNSSNQALAYSSIGLLSTSGLANVIFPAAAIGGSYYVVVSHRNSIAIWSATPVTIAVNGTSYNFANSASQAAGSNLADMGSGVFAMYTGDINQDGSIDFNDYPGLDIASSAGVLGYDVNDLNGDASVDFNDYPMIDINSSNGIITITP